jgi:triacylglycerol lipase
MTPIVLQHGLFGLGNFRVGRLKVSYFNGIDRAIAARGHPLIVPRVHPTGSIARRAGQLKRNILAQLSELNRREQRVVIIAHSLGGLDARYMISKLGMEERVAALVTISTPHRGSPYADWCVKHLGERLGGLKLIRFLGLDMRAIADLRTEQCARFNDEVPDSPGVKYFSISAARPMRLVPPFLFISHKVITDAEGRNDGLVSVRSAKWGHHLETWPADHLHVINKRLVPELRNATGDISPYYLRVLDKVVSKRSR